MYHLRLKGEHYQMGVKRGTIFQKANISFPLHLDSFQLEHGTLQRTCFCGSRSDLCSSKAHPQYVDHRINQRVVI